MDGIKPEQSALLYNKASENLIEITFVFAGLQAQGAHEKLCETDSITWKQMFVDWADEFETVHAEDFGICWTGRLRGISDGIIRQYILPKLWQVRSCQGFSAFMKVSGILYE